MNIEPIMGKSAQLIMENPGAKDISPPTSTAFLSIFNEGFFISSTTLFVRYCSENITAVEDGGSGRSVTIAKLIFGNTPGLLHNFLKSLLQFLQTSYKSFTNNNSLKNGYSFLYPQYRTSFTRNTENKVFKTYSSFRIDFLFFVFKNKFLQPFF